ncbi:hypothetical protein Curi_c25580 [Gottschalkia acidurici 9a]|uniref:Uncharacterized protein n=1 Tax=Gottschalkia acidurici (strain ATCC 7906 / DSM 604 / BCRC 14475 / CIP 104303 / KCTC 5404 / NCIMB 10678 / 9a) TaxID=1128398 RepID=K0B0I6_GOTA9|nr:hypothetical protein [Gottschalkia acidurici]AFS79553.1 hypothetical protein Curi_c25580 [Gottschalkia acidurici 9a]
MQNENENTVTPKEMKLNIELIKKNLPIFKEEFNKIARSKVEVNARDIDKIINKALDKGELSIFERRIMNGFYETWMAIFMMVGSDREALEIVFRMIDGAI